jgi:hypothetical protein
MKTPTIPVIRSFFMAMKITKKKMTSTEVCVILGRSLRTVQHLCKTGKLKAKKVGPLGRQSWEIWMDGGDVYGTGRKVVSGSDGRTRGGSSGKKTATGKGHILGKKRKSGSGR